MSIPLPADGLNGLAAITQWPVMGSMPNQKHQTTPGFLTGAPYQLAFVEFDDQGRCYDRGQMKEVATKLDEMSTQKADAIVLAFVHGWKHDARTDDENLSAFRDLLTKTAHHENNNSSTPRPVLGIFIGWRGLSEYGIGDVVADATFWGRQAAGQRVATGSVRELFGRLRAYRNSRLEHQGSPLLVLAGHSFGGMIVYSALAQSLIEAASVSGNDTVPHFADLVLLVNPAIEGSRYLPIYDLVTDPAFAAQRSPQLPVFVCAQADNDQPVGTWFAVGRASDRIDQASLGQLEKDCVTHSLGFVPNFRTHSLAGPLSSSKFVLTPPEIAQRNPFWVVGASQDVIDGHGGIWQQPFQDFLASILFQHVQASGSSGARRQPVVLKGLPPGGHLASFAQTFSL